MQLLHKDKIIILKDPHLSRNEMQTPLDSNEPFGSSTGFGIST